MAIALSLKKRNQLTGTQTYGFRRCWFSRPCSCNIRRVYAKYLKSTMLLKTTLSMRPDKTFGECTMKPLQETQTSFLSAAHILNCKSKFLCPYLRSKQDESNLPFDRAKYKIKRLPEKIAIIILGLIPDLVRRKLPSSHWPSKTSKCTSQIIHCEWAIIMLVLCNQWKQRHVDLRWMTSVIGVMIQSLWHFVSEGSPSQLPVIISFPAHVSWILKAVHKTSWNIETTRMEVLCSRLW